MSMDILLCPKTVYQFLSGRLDGGRLEVLPGFQAKELTLIRFWRRILAPIMDEKTEAEFFSTDDKRSRSLSNIMNRTGSAGARSTLFQLFSREMDNDRLLRLAVSFMQFLSEFDVDCVILSEELSALIARCLAGDAAIPSGVREHLQALVREDGPTSARSSQRYLFDIAVQLSWLTIYAYLGKSMGSGRIARLTQDPLCAADYMWLRYQNVTFGRFVPRVLTKGRCALNSQGLPRERFIDEQGRLAALMSALRGNHKVLVCGVGGIGKTELVRQAMAECEREALYARVAFVQGGATLTGNLLDALFIAQDHSAKDPWEDIRELLDRPGQGAALLLVDHLDVATEEEVDALSALQCDVIVTSRLRELPGFYANPVPALEDGEARKLLEATAEMPFSDPAEAFAQLNGLAGGLPLALGLLGRICSMRGMTVAELLREIRRTGITNLKISRYGKEEYLGELFDKLFLVNSLEEDSVRLLALLSTLSGLPRQPRELAPLTRDIIGAEADLAARLYTLAQSGWLEHEPAGYRMQPIVANTLLPRCGSISQYPRLGERLTVLFGGYESSGQPDTQSGLEMLLHFIKAGWEGAGRLLPMALNVAFMQDDWEALRELVACGEACASFGELPDQAVILAAYQVILADHDGDSAGKQAALARVVHAQPGVSRAALRSMINVAYVLSDRPSMTALNERLRELLPSCGQSGDAAAGEAVLALGELEQTFDLASAARHTASALRLVEALPVASREILTHVHFMAGTVAYASQELTEAKVHFQAAVEAASQEYALVHGRDLEGACYYLGCLAAFEGDRETADRYFRRYLSVPVREMTFVNLNDVVKAQSMATAYHMMRDYSDALEANTLVLRAYRRLISGNPYDLAAIWRLRGMIYYDMGKLSSALSFFQRMRQCLKGMVEEDHRRVVEADMWIARIYLAQGKRKEALAEAKKAEARIGRVEADNPIRKEFQRLIEQLRSSEQGGEG